MARCYVRGFCSRVHNVIAANTLATIGNQLRGKNVRAVGSDQHVTVEATGLQTYLDVTVYCDDARFDKRRKDTLLEPTVVIEVLSPSAADYDRTGKFDHFKQIPTLCDYLLIAQDKQRIEHFHRNQNDEWVLKTAILAGESVTLESIECALSLEDVYDGVDVPPALEILRAPIDDSLED